MTQVDKALAGAAAGAAPRQWLAEFVLLGAIWGSSFLFMRIATVEFGVIATAAVRVMVATLCLLPLVFLRGVGAQFARHWKTACVLGLLNSAIPFACFSFALLSITTGLSAILNATVPLFGALVAWAWLGERPTGSRMLGLAIGFAGVALLAWDQASFKPGANGIAPAWAVLACLVATLCYAVAASATKRYLAGVPAMVTAAGSQLGAALGLALPALWFWPARLPGTSAWLAVIALGVACTGVAYVLYFRLIEHAGPSRALAVTFLVPVFAVCYGALFLAEAITARMVLCGAIVLGGTALSTGWVKLGRRR
ncbi:DMT family transporter [Ramlibacter sp.]|uniref:DMT family transporter n=1 Tax=Ramlibacter sp. TaxID=1917967 RepID=UPI002C04373B|nr:EamA family transporter [Ramlibacter sp.]HWI82340.1 EamA family transporter [Ramlibacter sp.]